MKIYTRTGDRGETGLFGAGRVSKAHPRVSAYGDVDEVNSVLGWTLSQVTSPRVTEALQSVQHDLFAIGAELASPQPEGNRRRPEVPTLPLERIEQMERWIDEVNEVVEPLTNFILPGGTPGAAALHVSRTVCRRTERSVVRLAETEEVDEGIVRYLNRLSDLIFCFARLENHSSGVEDVVWRPTPSAPRSD